jgi:hypothetical protein
MAGLARASERKIPLTQNKQACVKFKPNLDAVNALVKKEGLEALTEGRGLDRRHPHLH